MGMFAALLSAVFSSSKDLISKKLAFQIDGMVSTFASFYFALPFYIILLAILYVRGEETFLLSQAFLTLVVLRSVTDTMAEGMKMHAFTHGDISIVATFFSLSPLFLLVTSPLITQDELTLEGIVAVFFVVGGSLILVYRPPTKGWGEQKRGIFLAVGAAFFFSLNSCFDRLAVQKGTPVFSAFAMTFLCAVILAPTLFRRVDRQQALKVYCAGFLLRGFFEIAFMVSKMYAIQALQAPYVVVLQRFSLILSIIGGRVFFRERDFARRLMAGLFIMLGVLIVAWLHLQKH